ncbi:GTPase HflX [Acetobacterium paludosum]|uniref:GTPase HflX n=1 Tax=Acetobacterium paludosum TaxID=52693 RepID=A0A923HYV6_9FIRM|nr:GTPase HflX [Acetobacterium paludosum]MBC3889134.1 GTPase HflX [Acetobacterium paludosum]
MTDNKNNGIRQSYMNELNDLIGYEMENQVLLDDYVLEIMRRLTLTIKREILIATNEKNRIQWVNVGDAATVSIGNEDMEYHIKSLNKYRVIHTHPGGNPRLSAEDFSAAKKQSLQCIVAIGVDEVVPLGFSIGVPVIEEETMMYRQGLLKSLKELKAFPLEHYILQANRFIKNDPNNRFDVEDDEERALLIGLDLPGNKGVDLKDSMEELVQLVKTAGGVVVEQVCQARSQIDSTFYVGKGKLQELIKVIQNNDINLIVANDELNSKQIANIEAATGTKTVDRTTIILDIFARHATTREGKLQVELAQQKYRMSHLKGLGIVMSRTGAGIGTRGPGEKKLETDRRHIRKQIDELEARNERINKSNQLNALQRKKNKVKTVSLIGYTNSGKSTLFNRLTQSEAITRDGLFITLDSTLRKVDPEYGDYLVSDTVGFIEKLPHDLITAFKTTLKEVETADLLLHVVDVSNHNYEAQIQVVDQVLTDIGVGHKKVMMIYNKIDKLSLAEQETFLLKNQAAKEELKLYISAKQGLGIDALFEAVSTVLIGEKREMKLLIPYDDNKSMALLHEMKVVLDIDYQGEGNLVTIEMTDGFPIHLFEKYKVSEV